MEFQVNKADLTAISHLRVLFLQEYNFEFIYDKCHLYGWADTYLFKVGEAVVGYGAVWGQDKREDRDAIFEFYIIQPFRKFAEDLFLEFKRISAATFINCQSNDLLLTEMLFKFGAKINAEAILFEDRFETDFIIDGTKLETVPNTDSNPEYLLKWHEDVVGSGGLMLNYNRPYADIYYEVKQEQRQKGFGSLLVQELKRVAYLLGHVPAARCNINNNISKATLLKSGFGVCGFLLKGEL